MYSVSTSTLILCDCLKHSNFDNLFKCNKLRPLITHTVTWYYSVFGMDMYYVSKFEACGDVSNVRI